MENRDKDLNQAAFQMFEALIETELYISELYLLYSDIFPEDRDFWWNLAVEEKNHAALMKSAVSFFKKGLFPDEILPDELEMIKSISAGITTQTQKFRLTHPSKDAAYHFAIKIEESGGEFYYQELMNKTSENKIIRIFQRLGEANKNHAERIRSLTAKYTIK